MLQIVRANQRGHADHGWLNTYHTFSFANYYNPEMMGFRALRVINEDRVTEGQGFGTHGHEDMEILSYVVEGAIAHKDSTGGEEILRPHEWQRMTAGTGIRHSEYNPSKTEKLHFYQIWILPEKDDLEAGYEQKMFAPEEKSGKLETRRIQRFARRFTENQSGRFGLQFDSESRRRSFIRSGGKTLRMDTGR
jgi:redox-sensitive bicupin YhaK (pirin superfamily)